MPLKSLLVGLMLFQETVKESPKSIKLNSEEQLEYALVHTQMQALSVQLDNLRLRVCIRADSGKTCGPFDPNGQFVSIVK